MSKCGSFFVSFLLSDELFFCCLLYTSHKIEQFNEEITRKQEEKLEDTSEKMNTISNEKIMGISEYSDQVIDKIEKNHAEVVFLYDMLNEKQAEIQKLIHEADSSKVQFQDELAKSYQNVKDIVDPVEVSGKDAKKTGNEQSDSCLLYTSACTE